MDQGLGDLIPGNWLVGLGGSVTPLAGAELELVEKVDEVRVTWTHRRDSGTWTLEEGMLGLRRGGGCCPSDSVRTVDKRVPSQDRVLTLLVGPLRSGPEM